jgi:hypothetical protein
MSSQIAQTVRILSLSAVALALVAGVSHAQPASPPTLLPAAALQPTPNTSSSTSPMPPVILEPMQKQSLWQGDVCAGSAWLGVSYFKESFAEEPGLVYGVEGAVRIIGDWAFYATAAANSYDGPVEGETEYIATFGFVKYGSYDPHSCANSTTFGWFFDRYALTEFEDYSTCSMRFTLAFAFCPCWSAGLNYGTPLNSDTAFGIELELAEHVGVFLTYGSDRFALSGELGTYVDSDICTFKARMFVPLTECLDLRGDFYYDDRDFWAGFVGVGFRFGGAHNSGCSDPCGQVVRGDIGRLADFMFSGEPLVNSSADSSAGGDFFENKVLGTAWGARPPTDAGKATHPK